jgi:ERF superfamily
MTETIHEAPRLELTEIEPVGNRDIVSTSPSAVALPERSPAAMMLSALKEGATLEQVEKMMNLQERWERREAEKAFADAMAEFKKNPPVIIKNKHVHYETDKGGVTDYDHASHDAVTLAVIKGLSEHGFSHKWQLAQREGKVVVTCVITHRLGHSESTTLESAPDSSGGKNSIQAIVSAKTYLERHTLLAATGLSTSDMQRDDDDGRGADDGKPGPITEKIYDGLLADLHATTTDAAAKLLWASGSKTLHATGRMEAYNEFKDAVVAHRTKLRNQRAVGAA